MNNNTRRKKRLLLRKKNNKWYIICLGIIAIILAGQSVILLLLLKQPLEKNVSMENIGGAKKDYIEKVANMEVATATSPVNFTFDPIKIELTMPNYVSADIKGEKGVEYESIENTSVAMPVPVNNIIVKNNIPSIGNNAIDRMIVKNSNIKAFAGYGSAGVMLGVGFSFNNLAFGANFALPRDIKKERDIGDKIITLGYSTTIPFTELYGEYMFTMPGIKGGELYIPAGLSFLADYSSTSEYISAGLGIRSGLGLNFPEIGASIGLSGMLGVVFDQQMRLAWNSGLNIGLKL
jgi:hypothetical protein